MSKADIIVIGGSAGAVEALLKLIPELPADLPAAVLVVVHMPAQHKSELPGVLGRRNRIPVAHAGRGQAIEPGHVYIAPPDHHLLVEDHRTRLWRGPRENGHRPAINALFRSAATAGHIPRGPQEFVKRELNDYERTHTNHLPGVPWPALPS